MTMLRAIRAGAAMLALIAPAAAQAQPRDEWQFGATIYAYFPDISGRTRFAPAGGGGEFTLDIGTILDNLKFAFMGAFEAHSGRWGDVLAAWRYTDYEMKSGKRLQAMTFSGPAVGALFRW
jgi:hypothetical protein